MARATIEWLHAKPAYGPVVAFEGQWAPGSPTSKSRDATGAACPL